MSRTAGVRGARPWIRLAAITPAVVVAMTLAACGSSSDDSTTATSAPAASTGAQTAPATTAGAATTADVAAGSCGSLPTIAPQDPDGVIAALPADIQEGYNGYSQPVLKSPWETWKPQGAAPYTVGVSIGQTETPFAQAMLARTKELAEQSELVDDLVIRTSNFNVQTQLQQVQAMIRDKVDILIVYPLAPEAMKPVIEAAGKAGIPVITPLNTAPAPQAIGLAASFFLSGALPAQKMAQLIGEKGNVLRVHGIPSTENDDNTYKGVDAVFENCPDIKLVGDVIGQFAPPVAKGETLKYLSANAQPIAGVIQTAGMAPGVIQAFEQAGREVPVVADIGAAPASLAYWRDHRDSYETLGTGSGVKQISDGAWNVALRMLDGRGVKATDIIQSPPLITVDNLDQWAEPGFTEQSVGYAEGPAGSLFGNEFLDAFFVTPGSPEGE